jgi:hypothetical protein
MRDLEHGLRELAGDLAWPDTPDLAAAVTSRLPAADPAGAPGRAPRPRRRRPRRLVVALLAALFAVPAAAFALPGPRHAILETLGLRHVTVERRPRVPAAAGARLGRLATLAAVPGLAGFVPQLPAALGPPDAVHVDHHVVTLVYRPEHVVLVQARGDLNGAVLRKVVAVDATIRRVRVGTHRGIYLPAGHDYAWTDATGPLLRSGPALVWEQRGAVLRLEGSGSQAAAQRIAASVP